MKLTIEKKLKKPILIHGNPNFGLVSTIAIKFLIDHLDVQEIGYIESEHLPPLTAIHKGKIIKPISIFYNEKYNLAIVQSLTEAAGHEWELAETMLDLAKSMDAKEIIVIEGMPSSKNAIEIFYYSNKNKLKVKPIEEGIVMGTTAALLLKAKSFPVTCIFAEAHSQMPDSESAAKVVECLDSYLKLKIDFKPLLDAAKQFESKLKQFIEKQQSVARTPRTLQQKEDVAYIG